MKNLVCFEIDEAKSRLKKLGEGKQHIEEAFGVYYSSYHDCFLMEVVVFWLCFILHV